MPWSLRAVAFLALAVSGALHAEGSVTPYANLFTVLAPAQQIAQFPHLRAVQRIDSRLPGVTPAQIHIVVKARRGDIAVPVAADGHIDFPLDDALRAENPDVHTNQPKGSLSLTVTMELKLPESPHIAWSDLHSALEEARAVIAAQARSEGIDLPGVLGVELRFPPGSEAKVTVAGKGERLLLADADGRAIVMLDEAAVAEQPSLELSQPPLAVLPFLQKAH